MHITTFQKQTKRTSYFNLICRIFTNARVRIHAEHFSLKQWEWGRLRWGTNSKDIVRRKWDKQGLGRGDELWTEVAVWTANTWYTSGIWLLYNSCNLHHMATSNPNTHTSPVEGHPALMLLNVVLDSMNHLSSNWIQLYRTGVCSTPLSLSPTVGTFRKSWLLTSQSAKKTARDERVTGWEMKREQGRLTGTSFQYQRVGHCVRQETWVQRKKKKKKGRSTEKSTGESYSIYPQWEKRKKRSTEDEKRRQYYARV